MQEGTGGGRAWPSGCSARRFLDFSLDYSLLSIISSYELESLSGKPGISAFNKSARRSWGNEG